MEVLSLRNLKVIYLRSIGATVVFPPQCLRCLGWNLLLMAQVVGVRAQVTDDFIRETIGLCVWNLLVAVAVVSGLFSLMTVFTDPGILPPINFEEARIEQEKQQLQQQQTDKVVPPTQQQQQASHPYSNPYGSSNSGGCGEVQAPNAVLESLNPLVAHFELETQPFCRKCSHLRPTMCAHCWWSDVCIMEMDHYCSILGVVVGARNLRWFLLYLLSMAITAALGVFVTFKSLEAVFYSGPRLLLLVVIICASLVAFSGTVYFFVKGIRLLVSGQSTRGEIKGLQTSAAAPKGVAALQHVLMPTLPSMLPAYFDEVAEMLLTLNGSTMQNNSSNAETAGEGRVEMGQR